MTPLNQWNFKMKNAVIFDMDGLLIDSEPLWKEAEIEVFKTVGIDLTEQSCEQTVGLRIDEVVKLWHSRHPWQNKTINEVTQQINNCMIRLIKEKGVAKKGVLHVLKRFKSLKNTYCTSLVIALSTHKRRG